MDPIESLLNKKLDQLQSEIDRLDSSPRVAAKLSFIKSLIAAETSGATGGDTSIRLGHIAARVAALESSLSAPKIEPCEKSAPKNPLFIDGCDDFQKKIETLKRFSSAGSDFSDLSQAIDEAIAANASSSSSSLSSSCSCTSSCFDGGEEKCATGINGTGELCFAETLKEVEENAESGKRFGRVFSAAVVAVAVAVAAAGVLVASFFNEEDVIYLVPTQNQIIIKMHRVFYESQTSHSSFSVAAPPSGPRELPTSISFLHFCLKYSAFSQNPYSISVKGIRTLA